MNSTEPSRFSTGQIISVSTGRLACPVEGVYEILNFLTGDNLFTHALPRAFHAVNAHVTAQFPWLDQVDVSKCTSDNWREWLADIEDRFGKEHLVSPCHELWQARDPLEELQSMCPGKPVIVIAPKPAPENDITLKA